MIELEQVENKKSNKKFLGGCLGILVSIFILVVVFGMGYGLGKGKNSEAGSEEVLFDQTVIANKNKGEDSAVDFSLFWEVWDLLGEKYVDADELDAHNLFYGAINGMLRASGDPYTTFFNPEENKKFNDDIHGSFEGIGAEIGIKGGVLTVIAPLKETPAENSGLRPGDKILEIDGENTAEMSIDQAVDMIRGQKGTDVILTIFRNGDEDTRKITITRNTIIVKSVEFEIKDDNIAYIELSRFGLDSKKDFNKILKNVGVVNAEGLILDLRNNPGGFLDVSVEIASKFIPKGKVVVVEEDREGEKKELFTSGGDQLSNIETIVLINEGSASASEILAGALRENRENVTILGKKSFGKGSVQELIPLPQSSAVKITVAKWLTPNGIQINEEGITPDIEVDLTNDDFENDRDPQLDRALEILKEKIK
ncbi:S41 family peptidase [Patescibacteria group bacterium]